MGDTNVIPGDVSIIKETEKQKKQREANNNYRGQLYAIYFHDWAHNPSKNRKDDLWTSSIGTNINHQNIQLLNEELIVPRLYDAVKNQLVPSKEHDGLYYAILEKK